MLSIYPRNLNLVLVPPPHVQEHREHSRPHVAGVPGVWSHVVLEDGSGIRDQEAGRSHEVDAVPAADVGLTGLLEVPMLPDEVLVELLELLAPLHLEGLLAVLDAQHRHGSLLAGLEEDRVGRDLLRRLGHPLHGSGLQGGFGLVRDVAHGGLELLDLLLLGLLLRVGVLLGLPGLVDHLLELGLGADEVPEGGGISLEHIEVVGAEVSQVDLAPFGEELRHVWDDGLVGMDVGVGNP